jgi:hypothetical protein
LAAHLKGFRGTLQVDGYAAFERLTEDGRVRLAACWAHTRRKFCELTDATGSPITTEALARIAALYRVEAEIRGRCADARKADARHTRARSSRRLSRGSNAS